MENDAPDIFIDGFEDEIYPGFELNSEQEQRATGYMKLKSVGAKLHPPIHKGCDCRIEPVEERAPTFKPAGSINEAEEWAENNIADKVNYRKLKDLAIANKVNECLKGLIDDAKIKYNEISAIDRQAGKWKGIFASSGMKINPDGTIKSRYILINQTFIGRFENIDKLLDEIKEIHKKQWWVAESIEDLIAHEYGHNLTEYKVWLGRKESPLAFDIQNTIYDFKNLGKYASTSADETLAEIYAKYKKGEPIKQEWKDLFNKFSEVTIK